MGAPFSDRESVTVLRGADEQSLADLLEHVTQRLDAGAAVDVDNLAAAHPQHAARLRELMPTMVAMANWGRNPKSHPDENGGGGGRSGLSGVLGDFRILSELGRGGMGTVFEAEQISMGRKVALKVLPFAALAQEKALQRFRNEVRAAAALDHPHIVPVYSVGEERGIHYYSMQLIRGQSLAAVIHGLREEFRPQTEPADAALSREALTIDSGVLANAPTKRNLRAGQSTQPHTRSHAERFRTAATIGIQAAEALQHAHDQGVLHRDIKPGNLMLDADGKIYVTDFGLARIEADAGMTMTGDIIGTLRYMAPEQALAKRVVIDHRADIYSLGATLYELLTLQPAFGEIERSDLLKQIAFEEPAALRKIDRQIPAELETIVLKAMAKNPADRYQAAQQLADDLRALLEHRPIKAKPPTIVNHIAKWSRRHVGIVWSALAATLAAAIMLATSAVLIFESRTEAEEQSLAAIRERDTAIEQRKLAIDERNHARLNEYYSQIVSGQANLVQENIPRLQQKLASHLPIEGFVDFRGWEWYYLLSQCRPEVRTLYFPGYTLSAAWSPDGRHIGSCGAIWEADSGKCLRYFAPSLSGTYMSEWSSDGNLFAWSTLTSGPQSLLIWDRRNDSVRRFEGHLGSVWAMSFSPDGSQLATGSIDTTVKVWDVASGEVLHTIEEQPAVNITGVAWSPDGELLAVGTATGEGVRIYSAANYARIHSYKTPGVNRNRVSWRPNGQQLAVNNSTGWFILDRDNWQRKIEHRHPVYNGNDSTGVDIHWNAAGTQIAYSERASVIIWDPESDKSVKRLVGHREPVQSVSWAPHDRQLLSTDLTNEIRIWDLQSPTEPPKIEIKSSLEVLSWNQDNQTLIAVSDADLSAAYWNSASGSQIKREEGGRQRVTKAMVLSPNRQRIAYPLVVDNKEIIQICDAKTGAVEAIYRCEEPFRAMVISRPAKSFGWDTGALAWSPDSSQIAIAIFNDDEAGIDVWDIESERRVSRWSRPSVKNNKGGYRDAKCKHITWSADGNRVAFVGIGDASDSGPIWASHLHIIDAVSGARVLRHSLAKKNKDGGEMSALAWSTDSRRIAAATSEGNIDIIDIDAYRSIVSLKSHDLPVRALVWNPDGTRVASGSSDGTVKILETVGGNELLTFDMGEQAVGHLAWSADGRRLAAASDKSICIWDASRGFAFAEGGDRQGELAWMYLNATGTRDASLVSKAKQIVELAPKTLDYRVVRGRAFARLGQFDEAAREFAAAMPQRLSDGLLLADWQMYAHLGARELDAFRKLLPNLLTAASDERIDYDREEVFWLACLIPDANIDLKARAKELRRSANDDKDSALPLTITSGALLYRMGQYAEAAELLERISTSTEKSSAPSEYYESALARFLLAMARQRLGHAVQAQRIFREATLARDQLQADPTTSWVWLVEVNALHREASALINAN